MIALTLRCFRFYCLIFQQFIKRLDKRLHCLNRDSTTSPWDCCQKSTPVFSRFAFDAWPLIETHCVTLKRIGVKFKFYICLKVFFYRQIKLIFVYSYRLQKEVFHLIKKVE